MATFFSCTHDDKDEVKPEEKNFQLDYISLGNHKYISDNGVLLRNDKDSPALISLSSSESFNLLEYVIFTKEDFDGFFPVQIETQEYKDLIIGPDVIAGPINLSDPSAEVLSISNTLPDYDVTISWADKVSDDVEGKRIVVNIVTKKTKKELQYTFLLVKHP